MLRRAACEYFQLSRIPPAPKLSRCSREGISAPVKSQRASRSRGRPSLAISACCTERGWCIFARMRSGGVSALIPRGSMESKNGWCNAVRCGTNASTLSGVISIKLPHANRREKESEARPQIEELAEESRARTVHRSRHDALRARVSASGRTGVGRAYRSGADEHLVDALFAARGTRGRRLRDAFAAGQYEFHRTHPRMRAASNDRFQWRHPLRTVCK